VALGFERTRLTGTEDDYTTRRPGAPVAPCGIPTEEVRAPPLSGRMAFRSWFSRNLLHAQGVALRVVGAWSSWVTLD
jgi:hypothetical protein